MSEEEKRDSIRRSLRISNINHRLENFKVTKEIKPVYDAFKNILETGIPPMLLVYGGVGNGKTFLCDAVSIALYNKGIKCGVEIWSELMRYFKRLMYRRQPDEPFYDDAFESIRKRTHLILDDVGMGTQGTEWEFAELEDITAFRYRGKLFTIMTTNLDIEKLPERVVSRFSDPEIGILVHNAGGDYRRRKVCPAP